MSKTIFDVSWLDLLPAAISGDANVQAIAKAMNVQLLEVANAIKECILLARLDELDEDVVDLLAWQYHVDFYDLDLTLAKKRELVQTSIKWHRKKGTKAAVAAMVSTVFSNGVVTEWFDYGGNPYYFRIQTDEVVSDSATYERLIKVINAVKNTRSWLDAIVINRTWSGTTYLGSAMRLGKKMTLGPVAYTAPTVTGTAYFGASLHVGKIMILEVS